MGFFDFLKAKPQKPQPPKHTDETDKAEVQNHIEEKAQEAHAIRNNATVRLLKMQKELNEKNVSDSKYFDKVSVEIGSIADTIAVASGRIKGGS